MSDTIMNKLKEELEGWKASLEIRTTARNALKIELRKKEYSFKNELKRMRQTIRNEERKQQRELKILKHHIYNWEKQMREAKQKIKYYDIKIKTTPSRVRQWNKKNFGKVIESFEKSD